MDDVYGYNSITAVADWVTASWREQEGKCDSDIITALSGGWKINSNKYTVSCLIWSEVDLVVTFDSHCPGCVATVILLLGRDDLYCLN